MASISANPIISQFDPYSYGTVAVTDVGQLMFGDSGKAFRFCYNATPTLVVGNAIQSSANTTITDFDGLAVATAAAKGDTKVVLTNGNTAVTAGMLVGGSFVVSTSSTASANIGEEYTIIDHSTASGAASLTVYLDAPLRTALTTATTTVALRKSPYYGVIQGTGGAATGTPVGIAISPIPAANYGWLQTKGVCGALSDGSTFLVGSLVGPSVATAGAVGVFVAGSARTYIGFSMSGANSSHAISVQLTID